MFSFSIFSSVASCFEPNARFNNRNPSSPVHQFSQVEFGKEAFSTNPSPISKGRIKSDINQGPFFDLANIPHAKAIASLQKAGTLVENYLARPNVSSELQQVFASSESDYLNASKRKVNAFLESFVVSTGENVKVELRNSQELMGAWAVFAAKGHEGIPVIYLNEAAADKLTEEQFVRVLVEEIGHWVDFQINGTLDSPGDEGEWFAAKVLGYTLTAEQEARILVESDFLKLDIDGVEVETELASLLFTNKPAYWIGATNATEGDLTLETNIIFTRRALASAGDRFLFVSIPEADTWFSGNNTKGWLYVVQSNNSISAGYVGEISRLYKTGSSIDGLQFYVYPTQSESYTPDRQTVSTSILIDLNANFQLGQSYNTSSDPVSAALNALLVPASLVATNDAIDALEAGGARVNLTAGTNPSGNVLSNDSGGVTSYSVTKTNPSDITTWIMSTSTSTLAVVNPGTIQGNYGALVLGANGAYTYTLTNTNALVEALRTTSNTLTDVFTYRVGSGSEQASANLTITIKGQNDAPVAADDYNTAKESIQANSADQYVAADPQGSKAIGNVFPNDLDFDNGDSKSLALSTSSASVVSSNSGSYTFSFTTSNGWSSVQDGFFAYLLMSLRNLARGQIF